MNNGAFFFDPNVSSLKKMEIKIVENIYPNASSSILWADTGVINPL